MKRGSSGQSLVVAVNKPMGMTSHDVVNRCRRIFSERRVGHTGTLDPLATGVLPICVGPATRLDRYMAGHDKRYRVTMSFGRETTTDDVQGETTVTGKVPADLVDGDFASAYVGGLVGRHVQVPPRYSAVKIRGKKAYELTRAGVDVALEPRDIEVYSSVLVERRTEGGELSWVIDFSVSKGTYIRALVRDMGRELGCPAHVSALERLQAGRLGVDDCVSLESLEALGERAALDPVRILGYRFYYADDHEKAVSSGSALKLGDVQLYEFSPLSDEVGRCACTSPVVRSETPLLGDEPACVIVANKLKAIYRFDEAGGVLKPDCVFSTPVTRSVI